MAWHQYKRIPQSFLRIDKYWSKVGKISYESGNRSSHNSAPERGFSINKILLDAHGTSMGENAISALPFGRLAFFYICFLIWLLDL